jgi:hypothetical protein
MTVAPLLAGAGEVVSEFGGLIILVVSLGLGVWAVGFLIRLLKQAANDGGILPGGFSYLSERDRRDNDYLMPGAGEIEIARKEANAYQDRLDHEDRQKPVIDRKRDGTAAYYHRARRREEARRGPINF